MGKYKLTKDVEKQLMEAANKLPRESLGVGNYHRGILGQAIGKKDNTRWHAETNIEVTVNHRRRIKKAYEKGGFEAVKIYIDGVIEKFFKERVKTKPVEEPPIKTIGLTQEEAKELARVHGVKIASPSFLPHEYIKFEDGGFVTEDNYPVNDNYWALAIKADKPNSWRVWEEEPKEEPKDERNLGTIQTES